MLENEISRRRMFQMGLGAAATAGLVSTTGSALSQTSAPTPSNLGLPGNPKALQDSVNGAYAFLTQMMDAYAQGATVRLSQSYADQIAGGQFEPTVELLGQLGGAWNPTSQADLDQMGEALAKYKDRSGHR